LLLFLDLVVKIAISFIPDNVVLFHMKLNLESANLVKDVRFSPVDMAGPGSMLGYSRSVQVLLENY